MQSLTRVIERGVDNGRKDVLWELRTASGARAQCDPGLFVAGHFRRVPI